MAKVKDVFELAAVAVHVESADLTHGSAGRLLTQPTGCLQQSELDEPVFLLCARDRDADELVEMWAALRFDRAKALWRRYEAACAARSYEAAAEMLGRYNRQHTKALDACRVADAMSAWRARATNSRATDG